MKYYSFQNKIRKRQLHDYTKMPKDKIMEMLTTYLRMSNFQTNKICQQLRRMIMGTTLLVLIANI